MNNLFPSGGYVEQTTPVIGRIEQLTYRELHEKIFAKDRLDFLETENEWKDKELRMLNRKLEIAEDEIRMLRAR